MLLSLIEENVFSAAPGKVSLSNITEDKYFAIRDRAKDWILFQNYQISAHLGLPKIWMITWPKLKTILKSFTNKIS